MTTVEGLPGQAGGSSCSRQSLPRADALGVLMNPDSPTQPIVFREIELALRGTPVRVIQAVARRRADLPAVFERLKGDRVDGIRLSLPDTMFFTEVAQIISRQQRRNCRLSMAIVSMSNEAALLATVSMSRKISDVPVILLTPYSRIKPGDLPIELPTKLELAINLKAAKALSLEIPSKFLFTADEVIE